MIILLCIGLLLNRAITGPTIQGISLTEEYIRTNYCEQSLVWFLIGILWGLVLILNPEIFAKIINLLTQNHKAVKINTITRLVYATIGIIILILTIMDVWRNCNWAIIGIFGR